MIWQICLLLYPQFLFLFSFSAFFLHHHQPASPPLLGLSCLVPRNTTSPLPLCVLVVISLVPTFWPPHSHPALFSRSVLDAILVYSLLLKASQVHAGASLLPLYLPLHQDSCCLVQEGGEEAPLSWLASCSTERQDKPHPAEADGLPAVFGTGALDALLLLLRTSSSCSGRPDTEDLHFRLYSKICLRILSSCQQIPWKE